MFTTGRGKAIKGYNTSFYNNIATRSGNNLVMTTLFTTSKGKIKKVTTTIKNYFADTSKDYTVNYDRVLVTNDMAVTNIPIRPGSTETLDSLYGTDKADTSIANYLLGTKGNDSFTFSYNAGNYVYDTKGYDSYLSVANRQNCITDLSGNETYNVHQGMLLAHDYSGNDSYQVTSGANLYVNDFSGKDSYGVYGDDARFAFNDYKGNDDYVFSGNRFTNPDYGTLKDYKGNDNYLLSYGNAVINDKGGKDTLNIKGVDKNDLVYFANIYLNDVNNTFYDLTDDELRMGSSLYIYNKKTNTYIDINGFFSVDSDENITGYEYGKIETYKVNNKKVNTIYKTDFYEHFNAIKENVASWLVDDSNKFDSVYEALRSGSETQINELIQIFQGTNT